MPGCMAAMEEALVALARGEFLLPLRPVVRRRASALLGLMPTFRAGDRPLYALKTVAVFPDNPRAGSTRTRARSRSTTATTGEVLAVMNASPITAIRTAPSPASRPALAREDAACSRSSAPATRRTRTSRRCSRRGQFERDPDRRALARERRAACRRVAARAAVESSRRPCAAPT
jgi:hypothetical protein